MVSFQADTSVTEAIDLFKKHGISQAPVLKGNKLLGIVTESHLFQHAMRRDSAKEKVGNLVDIDFCVVHDDTELFVLKELFYRFQVALVYEGRGNPKNILTRIDLMDYIAKKKKEG